MATTPALELDVLAPQHQVVNIRSKKWPEAKSYELRYESELSMEDIARLATLTTQAEPLINDQTTLTPPAAKLLDDWLDEALSIIFATELEREVVESMGAAHKWRVVEYFGDTCMNQSGSLQAAQEKNPETMTATPTSAPIGEK